MRSFAFRSLALFFAAAALAGCQSSALQTQTRFNPDEAAFIKAQGKSVISGHAFLKRATGVNVYASGEIVRLTPVTSYARERFTLLYGAGKFITAARMPKVDVDPVYAEHTRTTKADHMGRFSFDRVAPGRYYVSSQVVWRDSGQYLPAGGAMYDEVVVTGRESGEVEVILSGR